MTITGVGSVPGDASIPGHMYFFLLFQYFFYGDRVPNYALNEAQTITGLKRELLTNSLEGC